MGSHAKLSLGSLGLGTTKNGIDPELMWLFRPSDRHTEIVDRHGPTSLAKYINAEHIDDYDESNPLITVEYRCSAVAARDRLEIKGFTYEIAQASFMGGLRNTIDLYQSIASGRHTSQASPYFEEKLRLLRSLTLRVWLEAFARIKEEHLTKEALDELRSDDYQLPLLRHMLESSQDFYGFPGFDYRLAVRTILEVASPQDCLIYDLSDLVAGGWIEEASEFVALTEHSMNTDFLLFHRVIVLTEGDTDRGILERSLRLLYPHLADYFHFFDFTGRKFGGGVGELANLVRAFAAADVRHRILALFDNDTAAKASLSNLNLDNLPSHIAVRHYPNLPLGSDYPTLGPSGEARMDVNGLAGSIELYLGVDVLADQEGALSPVQWTGYDQKIKGYQERYWVNGESSPNSRRSSPLAKRTLI